MEEDHNLITSLFSNCHVTEVATVGQVSQHSSNLRITVICNQF